MTLDDSRRCPGGTTRVRPKTLRRECIDCSRRRPWGEDPGPDDIDPVGAWVDATAHREGYCRERRSAGVVLPQSAIDGMDDMAGVHRGGTVNLSDSAGKPAVRGDGDSAMHPDGGEA